MLLVLHVIWTYMILKIVVDSLQKGLVSVEASSYHAQILLTVWSNPLKDDLLT